MGNYLIDQMVWSYSRIECYVDCPYRFYLKYIMNLEPSPQFFASYGSFIHSILARYYSGTLTRDKAGAIYVSDFRSSVSGKAPSVDIFKKYYSQGAEYVRTMVIPDGVMQSVEEYVQYSIMSYRCVGYIDCIYCDTDGNLVIRDHKSRDLKPRSHRIKPTFYDKELDRYLRQLYLYSIPVFSRFSQYPDYLEFNCYRSGTMIKEKFHSEKLQEAKQWAVDIIRKIESEREWGPDIDYWKCRYLCGYRHECEYAQMSDYS